jgi:hypothetical protein
MPPVRFTALPENLPFAMPLSPVPNSSTIFSVEQLLSAVKGYPRRTMRLSFRRAGCGAARVALSIAHDACASAARRSIFPFGEEGRRDTATRALTEAGGGALP